MHASPSPPNTALLQVFLNDWAAAVPLGEEHPFFGALNFAADAVFTAYRDPVLGKACHDLEMIVKVMYACVHPAYFDRCFPKLDGESDIGKFKDAVDAWQVVRQLSQWKTLFDAAECTDYMALQELIRKYLPSVPSRAAQEESLTREQWTLTQSLSDEISGYDVVCSRMGSMS